VSTPTLIQRTSRAAFWNAALFPLKALVGLAFTVVVARRFGLDAGIYNTAMGVVATVVMFTSLGIPTSLTKFLPEVQVRSGAAAVVVLLRRVAAYRLLLAAAVLVPLNLLSPALAGWLDLGTEGVFILRSASVLIATRALFDLCIRSLNAFFSHRESNLLDLLQGILDFVLALTAVALGFSIGGVFGMIVAGSAVAAAVAVLTLRRALGGLESDARGSAFAPADASVTRSAVDAQGARFAAFALFTYLFELSVYFSDKSFAAPALAVILGSDEVAIFWYGFNLSFMSVGLMVASFRGVYRPMFAHLRARNDPRQLQRAFAGVSKAQLVVLMPAAVGLFVLMPDYIPLLYGAEFLPSVPIAQTFVVFLYGATAFNLGMIWLSIDERYRVVLWTQGIQVVAAPFFLIAAGNQGLLAAAFVFGGARPLVNLIAYLVCRRDYGFRFPWRFGARVGAVALVMGAVLVVARRLLETSVPQAVGLTVLGALVYLAGLRVARILGDEEIDLLDRSDVPGKRLVLAWLAPGR
jgi:O-antigen/teichoic acid export membrane protein